MALSDKMAFYSREKHGSKLYLDRLEKLVNEQDFEINESINSYAGIASERPREKDSTLES